jgi:hypothetical protein
MAEPEKGQSKLARNLMILAIIVVIVAIVSPSTIATVQNLITDQFKQYQDHLERGRAEAEADRQLKVSVQALEAELAGINVQATLEQIRLDVIAVKERAQTIRQRVLAIQDRAELVYGNRTDRDGLAWGALKQYGPTQEETLSGYLDLIDKAEKGLHKVKDPTDYLPLLRKIARYNREQFVAQFVASSQLAYLERRFR